MSVQSVVFDTRVARAASCAVDEALSEGPRLIVFVAGLHVDARAAFKAAELVCLGDDRVDRISRANGAERIEMANGSRVFFYAASGHGYRGVSADVLFVAEHLMHMSDMALQILPLVATGGRVITF